jgi:putative endonuclease
VDGTKTLGGEAEEACAVYLAERGYEILARNFRCRYGELDIVARRDEMLCFVEVRMRSSAAWGDPSQTVSYAKQRRVVKAALHYLQAARSQGRCMVRFDVISVVGRGRKRELCHIINAFDAGM